MCEVTAQEVEVSKANTTRFIPVARWNDYHPWPPQGGLRYLIFHEKTNGFSQCVIRVGRTVLIDEQAFLEWMRSKKGGAVR
jgi:hypothetical protein